MAKSRKRKTTKRRQRTRRGWVRPLGIVLALVSLAGLAVTLVWLHRLDTRIQAAFEGDRWAIPAHIYARPLEMYPGRSLSVRELVEELERLGYRRTTNPQEAGSFAASEWRVVMVTRPFTFADGKRPQMSLQVDFESSRIRDIRTNGGVPVNLIRLEPQPLGSAGAGTHEDRKLVTVADTPPALIEALLIIEDRSFFRHSGVDIRGIARAAFANVRARRVVQGGSTITQQLVKSFYLDSRRNFSRKITEAAMAILLERRYTKAQILEAYLNEVYLGQSGNRAIHGFGLAAEFYFSRPLGELSLAEISLLVGMVRGPSLYDPRRHPERALARRNRVLRELGSEANLDAASVAQMSEYGLGVTGRGKVTGSHPAFAQFVKRELRTAYTPEQLDGQGPAVFTTLEPAVQQIAEKTLAAGLVGIEKRTKMKAGTLEGAVVVVRVDNGEVMALVGGRKPGFQGFNRALDARRPVGSLLKPALYLTALEQPDRFTLASVLNDSRFSVRDQAGKVWEPGNYDGTEHGGVMLIDALSRSYNLSSARLGLDVGIDAVKEAADRLGLPDVGPAYPSLLLGAVDASPVGVAQMYQTLANEGLRAPLRTVVGVLGADGRTLGRQGEAMEPVADAAPVRLVTAALQEVMRTGTGRSVAERFHPALGLAGKTGTTNDYRDSWFAGYSGNYVVVVWVGRDDNESTGLTGASGALQIWADLMATLDLTPVRQSQTPDMQLAVIDPVTGLLGDDNCPDARELLFIDGSQPQSAAPCAGFDLTRPVRRVFGSNGLRGWFDRILNRDDDRSATDRSGERPPVRPSGRPAPVEEESVPTRWQRRTIEDSNR